MIKIYVFKQPRSCALTLLRSPPHTLSAGAQECRSVTLQKSNLLQYNDLTFKNTLSAGASERESGRARERQKEMRLKTPKSPTVGESDRSTVGEPHQDPIKKTPAAESRSGCLSLAPVERLRPQRLFSDQSASQQISSLPRQMHFPLLRSKSMILSPPKPTLTLVPSL